MTVPNQHHSGTFNPMNQTANNYVRSPSTVGKINSPPHTLIAPSHYSEPLLNPGYQNPQPPLAASNGKEIEMRMNGISYFVLIHKNEITIPNLRLTIVEQKEVDHRIVNDSETEKKITFDFPNMCLEFTPFEIKNVCKLKKDGTIVYKLQKVIIKVGGVFCFNNGSNELIVSPKKPTPGNACYYKIASPIKVRRF
jgi:hypothetical protein